MKIFKQRGFNLIIVGLCAFVFQSCGKKDCLSSAGSRTTISRKLDAFKQIELSGYYNVYLKSDTINQIEIEAGENQVPNIETSVNDSVLTINDLNACGFLKGYAEKNIYISFNSLSEIVIHDGVKLYSIDTLRFDVFQIQFLSDICYCDLTVDCNQLFFLFSYGSGDYILRGKTNYLYLNTEFLSFVNANELETSSCYVFNKSMGDCFVNTNGQLKVFIKDSGNIYYSGSPSEIIIEEKTGTGNLIKND